MSDTPYEWGDEHFCKEDATELYINEPQRQYTLGFPVELDAPPEPPTFCSVCLQWWAAAEQHSGGSDHRPPKKGTA